jgi:peptidyl-dipeptidase A
MKTLWLCSILSVSLVACSSPEKRQKEAQAFLGEYSAKLKTLYYAANEADWALNTKIVEGDTTNAVAARQTKEALSNFTGSIENIDETRAFLQHRQELLPLQVKQLEKILYAAANNPQTAPELVKARIKAETAQTEKLFGFDFKIDGKSVTTNRIDDILKKENEVAKRLQAWEASKEVGKVLKDGLENLQRLRNQTVQALGYNDYFTYQVSDYGMTTDEMMALMTKLNRELRPLFRELHTYARYELAQRYGVKAVPDIIPAHWLPNRWGQDWNELIAVEGVNLDAALRQKNAEWLVQEGENFYVSLGFPKLPPVFWEKSSLYPLPPEVKYKKNNHASAWHLDLENDIRSLMSVEPNAEWYETVNHELGHIHYYISYANPEVPIILREGANRAYHEAMGSLMGLAAMQKPFIENLQLIPANAKTDDRKLLLKEALNYVVFIPFSAGVMSEFEHDLYMNNLPKEQYNQRWWELCEKYQGMAPPSPRGEEYCDAASKTHINDDAAQYYDYALSYVVLFQLHDHIATKILQQDVHATNYNGSKAVGDFLRDIMRPGASRDWREVLREKNGEDLSARAMLKYFAPLMPYLQEVNKGRKHTLGEI